jgi:L-amino acid N-acyltransferase YncA
MRFFRKTICAFTLLRVGAFKVFLNQLRRQIYSRNVQIGIVKNLDDYGKNLVECKINYNLRQASEEDIKEAFQKVKTESKESAQMLLNRRWLYECGCGKWFVARTADTDELCYFQCVISPEDNKLLEKDFRDWFPRLKEDEIIMEGAYTFEKHRGNRVAMSVIFDILDIYREKGFKRMVGYIDSYREVSLGKMERIGFTRFEEITLHKNLFFTKTKSRPYLH